MPNNYITVYLVLGFLSKFFKYGLISGYYSLYLRRAGLDMLEINLVNVAYYVTLFVFEIPTGAFADVFGRRWSFIASSLLVAIGSILYGVTSGFWGFVAAEMITAVGATFASGAFEAWLVDGLKHSGNKTPLRAIFAKSSYYFQASTLVGSILGGLIFSRDMSVVWFVGGGGSLLVALLSFIYMKEPSFTPKALGFKDGWQEMKNTVNTSFRYGLHNPAIRYIILVASLQTFVLMAPNMQWSIWFGDLVSDEKGLGYIMAGNVLFMMLGARLVNTFLGKASGEERIILISQVGMGVAFVATVLLTKLWGLVPFFAHQIFRGFWAPVKEAYLHDHINSKDRATVVSFESILYHIAGALGLFLSGVSAKYFGIQVTWLLMSAVLISGTIIVYVKRR